MENSLRVVSIKSNNSKSQQIGRTSRNLNDVPWSKLKRRFSSFVKTQPTHQPSNTKPMPKRHACALQVPALTQKDTSASIRELSEPTGAELLSAIHDIFRVKNVAKLKTKSILAAVCNSNSLSARRLNAILQADFGLHSKDIRFKSGVFKGFYRKSVIIAWRCSMKGTA